MDRIFSGARVVLAWLGEMDDSAEQALRSLLAIAQLEDGAVEQAKMVDAIHGDMSAFGFGDDKPDLAIYAFLRRTWFRRAWIMQEAVLANRLVLCCGTVMLPFGYMMRAANFLYRSGWWAALCDDAASRLEFGVGRTAAQLVAPSVLQTMKLMFSGLYESASERRSDPIYIILEIASAKLGLGRFEDPNAYPDPEAVYARPTYKDTFTRYRILEVTDPRDKIYAFLGLRPGVDIPLAMQPDYTPESTTGQVYAAATKYLIETDGNLNILCHREADRSHDARMLPSWVPDYVANYLFSIGDSSLSPWSAGGHRSSQAHAMFSEHNLLGLRGLRIDTVGASGAYDIHDLVATLELLTQVRILRAHNDLAQDLNQATGTTDAELLLDSALQHNEQPGETSHEARDTRNLVGPGHPTKPQTRCEILWRTLLADCCDGQHPAPLQYGRAFASSIVKEVGILSAAAMREFADSMRPNAPQYKPLHLRVKCQKAVGGVRALAVMEREDCEAISTSTDDFDNRSAQAITFLSNIEEVLPHPIESKDSRPLDPALPAFWSREVQIHNERELFATAECGYLGYGPKSLRKGDEVWLLAGGKVPFLLRQRGDGTYTLIG
ncbi:hypothetical protein LTR85_009162 [Meristemomyces frigidus]|nr:hypothetical protein LTR85_009162 [Meristemomyces frigidus]